MKRNQERIEGNYSIVSVFEKNKSWADNDRTHRSVLDALVRMGYRVQELSGKWNGVEERSIRIEGLDHIGQARNLAITYEQEAYTHVGGGIARICRWNDEARTYLSGADLVRQVEVTDGDNYSEVQGFRWRFET